MIREYLGRLWARLRGRRFGDFMWTYSGRSFWPLDPRPEDVTLADIAHGLAHVCRYGGQCDRFYSVAQHCVLVSIAVECMARASGESEETCRAWALEALLHDASEAYIGDVVRPLKYQRPMRGYLAAERRVERAIAAAFAGALRPSTMSHAMVKVCDNRILVDECLELHPHQDQAYMRRWGEPLGVKIDEWLPPLAEHMYLSRYEDLSS